MFIGHRGCKTDNCIDGIFKRLDLIKYYGSETDYKRNN